MILSKRWKQFNEMLTASSTRNYNGWQRFRLFVDFLFNRVFRGVYLIDYIQYKFYDRNQLSRDTFMEFQKLHKLMDTVNNKDKKIIFDEKNRFNEVYKNYLNRDWIDLAESNIEEFKQFLENNDKIIIKPKVGSFGQGVEILMSDFIKNDLENKYQLFKKSLSIAEVVIEQHESLKKINETSLNTLRVVTMIDKNKNVHIVSSVLRIGRHGNVTDNFHNHGIASLVDIETGYVCTTGVDRDFKRYVLHPDSKQPICGFEIPNWKDVKVKVKELAMVNPDVRYVGWDIAIDKNGKVICVEGNYGADPDVTQTTDQVGKYNKYKDLI